MVESPDYTDPVHGIPVFSLYGKVRRPTPAMMDTFDVLLVDLQDVGCRVYTFVTTLRYVLEAAARARQGRLGARPAEPGRPSGRGPAAPRRLGELRRRRPAADAPRAHARRARRAGSCARCGSTSSYEVVTMEGWRSRRGARLRLAARRARLGEPEPERAEPLDGALLSRHGDARGHDALRGPRHDAAARAVRRAGPRRRRAARSMQRTRARLAARLPRCAPAGSSRLSTSTRASSAPASRSTSTTRGYDHERFARGG